jgi:hypothetical protein
MHCGRHRAATRASHQPPRFRQINPNFKEETMRKLSIALTAAAGLALVAGLAAAPALAELRITLGAPSYNQPYYGYQPNYGTNYYGYNRPYYTPYYGTYPNQGYTTYSYPNYAPYSSSYNRNYYSSFPGFFGR